MNTLSKYTHCCNKYYPCIEKAGQSREVNSSFRWHTRNMYCYHVDDILEIVNFMQVLYDMPL
jgi:hypothetical protein